MTNPLSGNPILQGRGYRKATAEWPPARRLGAACGNIRAETAEKDGRNWDGFTTDGHG